MIVCFYSDWYDIVFFENGFELLVIVVLFGIFLNFINVCRKKNWNVNVEENVFFFIVYLWLDCGIICMCRRD